MDLNWFNLSSPYISRSFRKGWLNGKYLFFRPWNLFNRRSTEGHFWGIGFFQINGGRHMFYIGHSGVSICFIGRTP